ADGADDGEPVRLAGQEGKVLGDEGPGDGGADGAELAADFRRLVRLGVEGVEVTHAAVEEDEDAAFGGRSLRGGERPQAEEVTQSQAGGAEGGALEELAAGESFRRKGGDGPHSSPSGNPLPVVHHAVRGPSTTKP